MDGRLWQLDFARGLALLMMLAFNWSFTLRYFGLIGASGGWLYWTLFPHFIGFMFVFIAGYSMTLAAERHGKRDLLLRGARVFALGMAITAVTYMLFPESFIFFGVLHLIGASIVLSTPLLGLKYSNLALGALVISAGIFLGVSTDSVGLAWLGFGNIQTLDYFPMMPWFGVFLLGLFAGKVIQLNSRTISNKSANALVGKVSYAGRKTLWVYLIHQPMMVLALLLLGLI